jgi:mannose-6-phosphate isomerase-like protein (cupin superfamily)
MRITTKSEIKPLVNPGRETVFELIGLAADHGGAGKASLAHVVIAPGKACSRHYHKVSEETYYGLHGAGEMVIDGQVFELRPGQACLIEPGETHQIFNRGDSDLEFLAVCAPAWAPGDSFDA